MIIEYCSTMNKLLILLLLFALPCHSQMVIGNAYINDLKVDNTISVGASSFEVYISALENKQIGVVANHTSLVEENHLVDLLLARKITIKAVYAPEHGFRGEAANGEKVDSGKDAQTGLT
ncbi:MAG: hypothetical protein ACI87V_001296, partial [Flavobacteriales bacterium]